MANKFAVASGNWGSTSSWSDTDGGAGGAAVPVNNDAVIICAGVSLVMNVDHSGFADGIAGLTIRGGATPGMLRFTGSTGYLKIKTGTVLNGTLSTNKGRLLASSSSTWGSTGAVAFGVKATIYLDGTAYIDAANLDIALYCTQPTNRYIATYGAMKTVSAVNTSANTLTSNSHGVANDTPVMVKSTGTLPAPLEADTVYYVRDTATNTINLAYYVGGTAIDLTSSGSGTISFYTGHTNTSTGQINVLTDVTSDTAWVTTDGYDYVALVDGGPVSADIQNVQLTTIASGSITLSANIDSAQYPGARIYLLSRNVVITVSSIVSNQPAITGAVNGVFQCEVRNTSFRGYGYSGGTGNSLLGTIWGVSYGLYGESSATIQGIVVTGTSGTSSGSGNTLHANGQVAGATTAFVTESNLTVAGNVFGCNTGISSGCPGAIISGVIDRCSTGINVGGSGMAVSGTVKGCGVGIASCIGNDNIISGTITNCINSAINGSYGFDVTNSGILSNSLRAFYLSGGCTVEGTVSNCGTVATGGSSNIISGALSANNESLFTYNTTAFIGSLILRNAATTLAIFINRNTSTYHGRVCCESLNRVAGADRIYDCFGDIIKTACDGTGDAPSVDPDGGNGYCIEAYTQSNCTAYDPLVIFDKHRIWLATGSYTLRYKIQSTYATLAATDIVLSCDYLNASNVVTTATSIGAVVTRDNDTDWTEGVQVAITQGTDGWVDLKLTLNCYEANNEIYVWPTPVIS